MHTRVRALSAAAVLFGLTAPASAAIEWVAVGHPGNAADATGFGAVAYSYEIAKTETTNTQYAEFLNAVAKADPNGLYNTAMATGSGIQRGGSSGSYTYTAVAGRESRPVSFVSFWDALRFANWLHNGKPTGPQGPTTTEDGAYTITAGGISDNSITRNTGATFALTSEDEWYKAAYFDPATASYFLYPTRSSAAITCGAPSDAANRANCNQQVSATTNAASYSGSASPSGTFDQGGNVAEWNESILTETDRGFRGGWFGGGPAGLLSTPHYGIAPSSEVELVGFRVTSLPEPGRGVLLAAGALGVLGLARRRRRSADQAIGDPRRDRRLKR
jgi:hypothetical protein